VLGPKFSKQDRAAIPLRREYSLNQVEDCRNLLFRRNFPIPKVFERSCELGLFGLTADKIALAVWCTICNNTGVIPFRVDFRPSVSLYEQVVYAAKRALVSGILRPGDAFPSVRTLSAELKINPNTAHKVVTALINEGLLEVMPGAGTVVARPPVSTAAERSSLLEDQMEQLVVEAKKLGLRFSDVSDALRSHWEKLEMRNAGHTAAAAKGGRRNL